MNNVSVLNQSSSSFLFFIIFYRTGELPAPLEIYSVPVCLSNSEAGNTLRYLDIVCTRWMFTFSHRRLIKPLHLIDSHCERWQVHREKSIKVDSCLNNINSVKDLSSHSTRGIKTKPPRPRCFHPLSWVKWENLSLKIFHLRRGKALRGSSRKLVEIFSSLPLRWKFLSLIDFFFILTIFSFWFLGHWSCTSAL